MKILMTTDNVGDTWNYSTELARNLRKKGIEITLAIMGQPLTDQHKTQLDGIAYFNLECKPEWMNPWQDIHIAKDWLLKIIKILQPDVVHMNTYATGGITDNNLPVIVNINFLGFNRWKALLHKQTYADYQVYEDNVRDTLKSAHVVIAPDIEMLEEMESIFGNFNKKTIMYCGKEKPLFRQNLRDKDPSRVTSLKEYKKAKMHNAYVKLYKNTREYGHKIIFYSVLSN